MPKFEIPVPPAGLAKNVFDIDDKGNVFHKYAFAKKNFNLVDIKSIKIKQYGVTAQEMITLFVDIKGKIKKIYVLSEADNKDYEALKSLLKAKCSSAFDAALEEGAKDYNFYHMDVLFPKIAWMLTFVIIGTVLLILPFVVANEPGKDSMSAVVIIGIIGLISVILPILWYLKCYFVKISPSGIMIKKMFSAFYADWSEVYKITDQKDTVVFYNYGIPNDIKSFRFNVSTKDGRKISFNLPFFKGKDFVAYLQKRNIGQEKK